MAIFPAISELLQWIGQFPAQLSGNKFEKVMQTSVWLKRYLQSTTKIAPDSAIEASISQINIKLQQNPV